MLKVIQLGLGPIGQQLTRYLFERPGIKITGAVDPDPQKSGKDLGKHAGIEEMGVEISPDLDSVKGVADAEIAVISTLSSLQKVEPQIKEAVGYGLDVVSTCEELSHPWNTQPDIASRIDEYCKEQGTSCLGSGVNPGFLMDFLPSVLTSVCRNVERIKVERIQDAQPRRKPFRDKIGVGLTESEFQEKSDTIRHVGLEESVHMIADAMNWELDNVCEMLVPVHAENDLKNDRLDLSKGQVAGVQQVARGYIEDKEVLTLIFKAAVGIEDSHDTVHVTGTPGFTSTIEGGINGDIATSAIIVNAIRAVQDAGSGLKTMLDIQAPAFYSEL